MGMTLFFGSINILSKTVVIFNIYLRSFIRYIKKTDNVHPNGCIPMVKKDTLFEIMN